MGNYNVGNETKNGSRCVCKWKGVVCLAGILISLVVGSFCVVTYGASAGEADGSESEQVDTSGNPTSDVEDGLTGTTGGYAEQKDGDLPIQNMFDKCRKVFCRYQTYPIENHLKEKEAYQSLDNTKLSWWFRRDMNHGPSGCDDTIDISEYDAYYLDQNASKKNEKVVYLTFDCGYENGYTEQMLDILKKEDVPACFFVTQTYIRDNVAIAKRMKEEGHQVGNHTIYHICMPDKSYEEIVQEVNGCADYMKEATGYAMDPYLRPPCGEYSARTLGWFSSMHKAGLLEGIFESNLEWINVFSVDNVLQRIADPVFLGATIDSGKMSGAKVVRKACPEEKVGVMCKEDGKPHIIEYYEMTDDMLNKRLPDGSLAYGFGAILNYLFPIQRLKETLDKSMPLHIVKKKVPYVDESGNPVTPAEPNAFKFETLALDLIHEMDDCLIFEVDREHEFAPVKNSTGVDSVDTARALLEKNGYTL